MADLSADQLTELRAIIEDALRVLKRSISISEETSAPVTLNQSSVGRLSRMDAMQSQALQSELRDRELGRLLVVPEARICVKCGPRGLLRTSYRTSKVGIRAERSNPDVLLR